MDEFENPDYENLDIIDIHKLAEIHNPGLVADFNDRSKTPLERIGAISNHFSVAIEIIDRGSQTNGFSVLHDSCIQEYIYDINEAKVALTDINVDNYLSYLGNRVGRNVIEWLDKNSDKWNNILAFIENPVGYMANASRKARSNGNGKEI